MGLGWYVPITGSPFLFKKPFLFLEEPNAYILSLHGITDSSAKSLEGKI